MSPVPVPVLPVPMPPVGAAAATLAPAPWAELTYGAVRAGDVRRTRRLVTTMAAIAAQPTASLPQQLRVPAAVKAAYRLLQTPALTPAAILAPHLAATRAAATGAVVLLVQDTTQLDSSAHPKTVDLGPLGDGRKQGLLVQSALAIRPADGAVLGLAGLEVFPRIAAPRPGERPEERIQRPRESDAWGRLVAQLGPPPDDQGWVQVGDRGSDVFTFFAACRTQRTQVLVRVAQDRRLTTDDDETAGHLRGYAQALPPAATRPLAMPSRVKTSRHPARPARETTMAVSWAPVTIAPPFHSPKQAPLPAWVVRTWEPDPPPDEPEPLEWILLTTVPTPTAAAAWERVDWYCRRWLIEDYHQCLKTGCRIEHSQLRDRAALERLVAMLAPVAVRLLQLRAAARATPEQPAAAVVDGRLVQVVAALTGQRPDLSCAQFWQRVAQLGGHQGRTRDGPPGWRTIWRGWQYAQTVLTGVDLAMSGDLRDDVGKDQCL